MIYHIALFTFSLVTPLHSSYVSETAKKTIGPVSPANPGGTGDSPPACYTKFFLGLLPPTDLEYDDPPGGLRYICQTAEGYPGKFFYATLFSETKGIALFSAYNVTSQNAKQIKPNQRCTTDKWYQTSDILHQGSDELYKGSSKQDIARGHLNPCNINAFDEGHLMATFRYTNAVPQYGQVFNSASWKRYENYIKEYAQKECDGNLYLITGTSKYRFDLKSTEPAHETGAESQVNYFPDGTTPGHVVRPNSMWTAGCCIGESDGKAKWSIALMGNNRPEKEEAEARPMSLTQLEKLLVAKGAKQPANLFPAEKGCRADTDVLEKWKKLQRKTTGSSSGKPENKKQKTNM